MRPYDDTVQPMKQKPPQPETFMFWIGLAVIVGALCVSAVMLRNTICRANRIIQSIGPVESTSRGSGPLPKIDGAFVRADNRWSGALPGN